jgi:hypothetical protein
MDVSIKANASHAMNKLAKMAFPEPKGIGMTAGCGIG